MLVTFSSEMKLNDLYNERKYLSYALLETLARVLAGKGERSGAIAIDERNRQPIGIKKPAFAGFFTKRQQASD